MKENIFVLALMPFWRYAVGPTNLGQTAIPFYSEKAARQFFEETIKVLPWCGCRLYKRRWFRGIEAVEEYVPNNENIKAGKTEE